MTPARPTRHPSVPSHPVSGSRVCVASSGVGARSSASVSPTSCCISTACFGFPHDRSISSRAGPHREVEVVRVESRDERSEYLLHLPLHELDEDVVSLRLRLPARGLACGRGQRGSVSRQRYQRRGRCRAPTRAQLCCRQGLPARFVALHDGLDADSLTAENDESQTEAWL
jgi:hypothetical protein